MTGERSESPPGEVPPFGEWIETARELDRPIPVPKGRFVFA